MGIRVLRQIARIADERRERVSEYHRHLILEALKSRVVERATVERPLAVHDLALVDRDKPVDRYVITDWVIVLREGRRYRHSSESV
jgi:hypothetical protein